MNSTANALANGGANGIGNHLIGLQPPLSPPPVSSAAPSVSAPAPVAAPAPAPAVTAPPPTAPAPAAPAPSTENLLVRFGLISTEQLDEALQDQRGSGKHVAQIAVERGWVTREQLSQLIVQQQSAPAPAETPAPPAEAPAPAPAAEAPAPDPEPEPQPTKTEPVLETVARVYAKLSNGDRVEVGSFTEIADALRRAEEVVADLKSDRPEWPCFSGRFLRPEAIVSVDVEAMPR
ncbi:MAG TPA: hypothetical protein VF101_15070 [Gaiellaceae bacterium]